METLIPNFVRVGVVAQETIARYRDRVPAVLTEVWSTLGYGTALDGFVKIIDPDVYAARISQYLPRSTIPIAATAFADIIIWDELEQAAAILRYRHGVSGSVGSDLAGFFLFMGNKFILQGPLAQSPYPDAVSLLGEPSFDECFGYVPLLALGGFEDAQHLEKMDLLTHVELINTLVGPVPY